MTPDVAWVLGKALSMNTAITSLDLRSCGLEADGAKLICRGLQANMAIKKLNLMSNDLRDASVVHICALFKVNVTLETVDLRSNGFGAKFDARALITSLRANEAIQGALRLVDLRAGGTTPNRIGDGNDELEILKKYIRDLNLNRSESKVKKKFELAVM